MAPARKTPAQPPEPGTAGPSGDTADSGPRPSMCRIVVYRLSEQDVSRIQARRKAARARTKYAENWPQANEVHEGGEYPLLIVHAWENGSVNGTAQLDGEDTHWVTSRPEGTGPGTWAWPERI